MRRVPPGVRNLVPNVAMLARGGDRVAFPLLTHDARDRFLRVPSLRGATDASARVTFHSARCTLVFAADRKTERPRRFRMAEFLERNGEIASLP